MISVVDFVGKETSCTRGGRGALCLCRSAVDPVALGSRVSEARHSGDCKQSGGAGEGMGV